CAKEWTVTRSFDYW
nr:immunoglobulin heavy chain junction region [Macaca mulatta]